MRGFAVDRELAGSDGARAVAARELVEPRPQSRELEVARSGPVRRHATKALRVACRGFTVLTHRSEILGIRTPVYGIPRFHAAVPAKYTSPGKHDLYPRNPNPRLLGHSSRSLTDASRAGHDWNRFYPGISHDQKRRLRTAIQVLTQSATIPRRVPAVPRDLVIYASVYVVSELSCALNREDARRITGAVVVVR